MTRQSQKAQELAYANCAAVLLHEGWILKPLEKPDFCVCMGAEEFGLEVVTVYWNGAGRSKGSKARELEGRNESKVRRLKQRYYEKGGVPIQVKFLGDLDRADEESLIAGMLSCVCQCPKEIGSHREFRIEGIKLFVTMVPDEIKCQGWVLVDDRVGYVGSLNLRSLQEIVDDKGKSLDTYKEHFSSVSLLVVADRTLNSGKIVAEQVVALRNPGFRDIYFLSYPESIQKIMRH